MVERAKKKTAWPEGKAEESLNKSGLPSDKRKGLCLGQNNRTGIMLILAKTAEIKAKITLFKNFFFWKK